MTVGYICYFPKDTSNRGTITRVMSAARGLYPSASLLPSVSSRPIFSIWSRNSFMKAGDIVREEMVVVPPPGRGISIRTSRPSSRNESATVLGSGATIMGCVSIEVFGVGCSSVGDTTLPAALQTGLCLFQSCSPKNEMNTRPLGETDRHITHRLLTLFTAV